MSSPDHLSTGTRSPDPHRWSPPTHGPRWQGPPPGHPAWRATPGGPPPELAPPGSRGWRWGWIAGTAGVLVVLGLILAVVLQAMPRLPDGGVDGGDGVGDPYFPAAGGGGYDALAYHIDVTFDETEQALTGSTMMRAKAEQSLSAFHVDLGLDVDQVTVNGVAATVRQTDWDVMVIPGQAIPENSEFTVDFSYRGKPGEVASRHSEAVWTMGREYLIAHEPRSAPYWFPSNDHPSDPALMEVTVTVPQDLQAISIGRLESRDTRHDPATDTWHWVSDQPMATYLNFLAIGQFDIQEQLVGGRQFVYAASDQLAGDTKVKAMEALARTPEMVNELEHLYGPYPFTEYGGLATALEVPWGALENQPRPVYDADYLVRSPDRLLVHELAHMWFGNNVTLHQWDDVFMNESYASHAEWLVAERTRGEDPNQKMRDAYNRARGDFWSVRMDDPGSEQMFTTVYSRGPMALQALRNIIGAEAFFALAREWAQNPGSRSLEDWQAMAQRHTAIDLQPYFAVWLTGTEQPAATAENGFR